MIHTLCEILSRNHIHKISSPAISPYQLISYHSMLYLTTRWVLGVVAPLFVFHLVDDRFHVRPEALRDELRGGLGSSNQWVLEGFGWFCCSKNTFSWEGPAIFSLLKTYPSNSNICKPAFLFKNCSFFPTLWPCRDPHATSSPFPAGNSAEQLQSFCLFHGPINREICWKTHENMKTQHQR